DFLESGAQAPFQGLGQIVDNVVNDCVETDFYVVPFGELGGFAFRPHVETDHDPFGSGREKNVALVDGAHAGADDAQPDLVLRDLLQLFGEGLDGALHVGFENEGKLDRTIAATRLRDGL